MDGRDNDKESVEEPSLIEDLPDKPSQAEGDDDETADDVAERARKMRE